MPGSWQFLLSIFSSLPRYHYGGRQAICKSSPRPRHSESTWQINIMSRKAFFRYHLRARIRWEVSRKSIRKGSSGKPRGNVYCCTANRMKKGTRREVRYQVTLGCLVRCITVLRYIMDQLHRMTARTNLQMQLAIQILLPTETRQCRQVRLTTSPTRGYIWTRGQSGNNLGLKRRCRAHKQLFDCHESSRSSDGFRGLSPLSSVQSPGRLKALSKTLP